MVPASDGCVGTLRKTARLLSHLDTLTPDWLPYNTLRLSQGEALNAPEASSVSLV